MAGKTPRAVANSIGKNGARREDPDNSLLKIIQVIQLSLAIACVFAQAIEPKNKCTLRTVPREQSGQ